MERCSIFLLLRKNNKEKAFVSWYGHPEGTAVSVNGCLRASFLAVGPINHGFGEDPECVPESGVPGRRPNIASEDFVNSETAERQEDHSGKIYRPFGESADLPVELH